MALDVTVRANQTFRAAQFWPSVRPWPAHIQQQGDGYQLILHDGSREPIRPGAWVITTPSGRWYTIDQSLFDLLFRPVSKKKSFVGCRVAGAVKEQ